MPGPIASGLKRRLRTSGGDAFYMFMMGTADSFAEQGMISFFASKLDFIHWLDKTR